MRAQFKEMRNLGFIMHALLWQVKSLPIVLSHQFFNMRLSCIYSRFIKLLTIALLTNQFTIERSHARSTPELANSPAITNTAQQSPKALVEEIWQTVERKYIDRTFNRQDWNAIGQRYLNRSYASYEEAYQAIGEMLRLLNDPSTVFYDPVAFKRLQVQIDNVTGIGLQLIHNRETGAVTIITPMENTAAQKAGLFPQDIITTIDGKPADGLDLGTVVTMLQGKVGTSVTLGILRKGQPITFRVQRTKIEEIISVRYRAKGTEMGRIGYIRLTQFDTKATQVMKAAIEALEKQNVKGYVLDLRSNPGGLLQASRDIARMWLSNGVIINSVDRDGKREQELANNRAVTQKPLVVLVDGGTANASEVLAAALQENQRALLVGKRTFGFNSIYSMRQLQNGTGFRMRTHKWLTPAGRDINRTGLNPDVVVEVSDSQRQDLFREGKIGTAAEPQFAKALEILNQKLRTSR